ncbi:MAG: hypothetical protein HQ522_15990 [Bacteroidetes bacterium]|nr:hypothetical protein [Bacteroidota bacterium]
MDISGEFDLKAALEQWEKSNFSQKEVTPADKKELKSHILDSIDELQENGLSEEEAFAIAQMRFGDRKDWGEEMQTLNEDNFQLKKIVLLFSGVILFIFFYNLILCSNRLLLLWSNYYNGDVESNVKNVRVFYNVTYALLVSSIVALYFLHEPIKWLFEKVILNSKWIILLILALIVVVGAERLLAPQLRDSINNASLEDTFFSLERYFKYIYIFIIGIGYVSIYKRYQNK